MPWVLNHRREEKQPTYCDCDECPDMTQVRQQLGCGKLPESERGVFRQPSHFPGEDGTCPGYVISLPQVLAVARLHPWWERGELVTRLGEQPTTLVMDGLDVLEGSRAAAEAYIMERASG